MIQYKIGSDEWLRILEETMAEVASVALDIPDCVLGVHKPEVPEGLIGAYLPLAVDDVSVQIGLLSDTPGCQFLSKALLGLSAEDEDLNNADLGDALSEIANVVAGGIKRRVQGRVDVKLGLPLFVKGVVQPSERIDIFTTEVRLSDVVVTVLLASPKERSTAEHVHEVVRGLDRTVSMGSAS